MTTYVALLRAINVGGTGRLQMSDLKEICLRAGFLNVRTYVASGNVIFESPHERTQVKADLERPLSAFAGKRVGILVRTADEMLAVLRANPFAHAEPSKTCAIFLDEAPPRDALEQISGRRDEEVRLGREEIFVHYRGGQGRSKLRIPAAKTGTARNMNTVAKLAEMASSA